MYYNMKAHVVPLFFNFFCVVNSVSGITIAVHQNANLNPSHPTMQDVAVVKKYGDGREVWGVYDGHGSHNDAGAFCAWKVAEDIAFCVPRFGWDARRVAERYVELDEEFAAEPRGLGREGGTTATTVLFDGINKLDIIHVGDCRVLIGNTEAYGNLTRDHSLLDPAELRRVIAADVGESFLDIDYTWDYMRRFAENRGLIKCCGQDGSGRWYAPRLCLNGAGDLNVVRTIGDRRHKNRAVATAVPDVTSYTLTPGSEFLAIVSDGITEAMNSAQIATIISNVMRDESVTDSEKAKIAAKAVVGCAKLGSKEHGIKGSCDNLTALVVIFDERKDIDAPGTPSGCSSESVTTDDSDPESSPEIPSRRVGGGH